MSTIYPSFETERLLLQPTTTEDAAFILTLLNTPKWLQYIGDRNVRTLADARTYINNRIVPQFERFGFGNYTISSKQNKTKLGSCGLYSRQGLDSVDIGFAFLPEYEGKGYALEAASILMQAATKTFGLTHICAVTTKNNLSSQKLLEKLGLHTSKTIILPNSPEELLLYEANL
jgi:[ribosomal protein S5]-alanine N-acetyltransferase